MTIRSAVEGDVDQIRALIESIPGLWHPAWRSDVLERAIRSAAGLAVVWIENDDLIGFACAHDVGFLAYLSLLAVAEAVGFYEVLGWSAPPVVLLRQRL